MPSFARQALLMPFWLAQVFTQEKFFARNPIIGNRWLNERGLHTARVRTLAEAVADPHFETRRVFHKFDSVPGMDGGFGVPLAAFKFAHGGPSIETPPRPLGADTDSILGELGYGTGDIAALRAARVL